MIHACGTDSASGLDTSIRTLEGDDSVLCAGLVVRGRATILLNARFPHAREHAEQHLAHVTGPTIWLCDTSCPGAV